MITPIVSVIIPVYNGEKYISRCLRSLTSQTINDSKFEVVIVNDGSEDNTVEIIQKFKENLNIVVVENPLKTGLPAALNKGIRQAKGQYVIRVDSDDYVHSEYLNVMLLYLNMNNHYDAVACDYFEVNDLEDIIRRVNCSEEPIGCGIMFRYEQLVDIGLYDESMKYHEDKDLRHRFCQKYNVERLVLPLYRYRKHDTNMTKDTENMEKYMGELSKKHSHDFRGENVK